MASNTFSLKIISANRVFFTGRCQSIIVPGYDGQKEVLAHHENMVIAVNEGEMRFLPREESELQEHRKQKRELWRKYVRNRVFRSIIIHRLPFLVQWQDFGLDTDRNMFKTF